VIVTPHIAWAGQAAMQELCDQVIDAIEAYQQGRPINTVS
jgi:glycerate dehydrogenase